MKQIVCPYSWFCGKAFGIDDVSDVDKKRVLSVLEKKMKLIFIHCPHCQSVFDYNPLLNKSTASHYVDPNEKEAPKKSLKEMEHILSENKIIIPESYFNYLISEDFAPHISLDEGEFMLYNLNDLCEKVSVDGKEYLQIVKLQGFGDTLKRVIGDKCSQKDWEDFTYTKMGKCLAIGHENTRILFIDNRDNNSLWIFHLDGGDVEKASITFDDIIVRKNS